MEQYNLEGPPLLVDLPTPSQLSPAKFKERLEQGALVLDTRSPSAFGGCHIKGSFSLWIEGLPGYAGWMLSYEKPILLILGNTKQLKTIVPYLVRLGYDQIEGYLCAGAESCGLESWYTSAHPIGNLGLLSVQELKERLGSMDNLTVLDVRTDEEWSKGHIKDALHIFVGHLEERLGMVPVDKPVAAICSVGNRGSLAASILLRAGRREVYNVLGGMTAWQKADYPIISR